jgi:fluoride ion exporter CrcB/FEX
MLVAAVAFAFIFGGAVLGILLRRAFPEQHLNSDTRDVVRVGTGLIATLSALVLGLLIASAQGALQTQSNQIRQMTANIIAR